MLKQLQADGLDLSAFWTAEEFATLFAEPTTGLTDENAVVEPGPTDIVRGELFVLGSPSAAVRRRDVRRRCHAAARRRDAGAHDDRSAVRRRRTTRPGGIA